MFRNNIQKLQQRIRDKHQDDPDQLNVIFTESKRILVEAPAGYGKTSTMVSKIAYMMCTKQIPSPKRLLALTFSVNAAYKIKKDIANKIPELLVSTDFDLSNDRLYVSNYHGFSRSVLKKYGKVYHEALSNIDILQSIDDSDSSSVSRSVVNIPTELLDFLKRYSEALKNVDQTYLDSYIRQYNDIVVRYLLPVGVIPYNAIITLTIQLFEDYDKVLKFYHKYFKTVLVDEFQDTNILGYWLLLKLIDDDTRVILLGDSLQRIYGFIGAVPNLLDIAIHHFGLERIVLSKNYRFASNEKMLLLDYNIRRNAEDPQLPRILKTAQIELHIAGDQDDEARRIIDKCLNILSTNSDVKIAILNKQRGPNLDKILQAFSTRNVPYFNGLFSDEDINYIDFHKKCLTEFTNLIRNGNSVSKKLSRNHIDIINSYFLHEQSAVFSSLRSLLKVFWDKIFSDNRSISHEEKNVLIRDTFEHNGLKQYVEFVESDIIISTVHAAKGLEWDYVILPDMEQDMFPGWKSMCSGCNYNKNCRLIIESNRESKFLEELSVFYVGITRSKRDTFFFCSKTQDNRYGARPKNVSCFLSLPGINYIQPE